MSLRIMLLSLALLLGGCAWLNSPPPPDVVRHSFGDLRVGEYELVSQKNTPRWKFWAHPQTILIKNVDGVPEPMPLNPSDANFLSNSLGPFKEIMTAPKPGVIP